MSLTPKGQPPLDTEDVRKLMGDVAGVAETNPPPQLPGFLLGARFGGGYGHVFQAEQVQPSRTVAIKVLQGDLKDVAAGELLAEAKTLASFDPNDVVMLIDAVLSEDGRLCLVMEWASGGDLHKKLAGKPQSNPRDAARLVERLARIVEKAHARSIFHRDLKPSNVLLTDGTDWIDKVRLGDFGLALNLKSAASRRFAAQNVGTGEYKAPEMARIAALLEKGSDAADAFRRIDVFGLGAILYECLTGRPPWKDGKIAAPRNLNQRIPHQLEAICLKALSEKPEGRYATAAALADDLLAFLEQRPPKGVPAGRVERVGLFYRRYFWPVNAFLLLVLAAFILALGVAVSSWLAGEFFDQKELAEKTALAEKKARLEERKARQDATFHARQRDMVRHGQRIKEAQIALKDKNAALAFQKLMECDEAERGWEWHELRQRVGDELKTLTLPSHVGQPTALALSREGRLAIAFAGGKIEVGLPERKTVIPLASFRVHQDRTIKQFAFTPDDRFLLAAGLSESKDQTLGYGTIVLCDLENPKTEPVLIADDFHILKWDGKRFKENPAQALTRFALSPDGKHIVYPAERLTAKVFDLAERKLVTTLADHEEGAVLGVSFSPDGKLLATAGGLRGQGLRPIVEMAGAGRACRFLPL